MCCSELALPTAADPLDQAVRRRLTSLSTTCVIDELRVVACIACIRVQVTLLLQVLVSF